MAKHKNPVVVTQQHPKSAAAEAFRTLRTNLSFASPDHPCRSILFTSSNPDDGKSTVTTNLAVVLAQAEHKVLLVDADLRKPVLHRFFHLSNGRGLVNALLGRNTVEELASEVTKGLWVLTSGPIPPNPSEVVSSARMRGFWAQQLQDYDYVLVDASPVLPVSDAVLLSTQVDGVIIVVKSGTRVEHVQAVKEQLQTARANIIGVILNKVKLGRGDYYYYHQYYAHA